jgi:uncharacterized membrane protein YeaQ/YmgE (transglycosylase-associated protein family)
MENVLKTINANPTIVQGLILLAVAGLCGGVAQKLAGGKRVGCLASIVLGFIGALIGTVIAQKADLPVMLPIPIGDQHFPFVWSVIGASLFSAVLAFLSGSNRGEKKSD